MVPMMISIMAMFAMAGAAPADLAHSTCTSGECNVKADSLLQASLPVHRPNSADLPFADFDDSEEDDSVMLEEATTVTEKKISDGIATSQEADDCKARLNRFNHLGDQKLDANKAGKDPLFPAVGASIAPAGTSCGDSAAGVSESCDKYNHWKTFQDVASYTINPFKVFGPSGIEFGDIGQGELGHCYFLAALAAIATHHAPVISDMFVERESWKDNVFKTKWLVNGKESVISVDNMIPANDDGNFFTKQSATGEWWPVILAKTWAKIYGSYKAIEGGIAGNVFGAITRAPVAFNDHEKLQPEALFKALKDASTAKFPMTAGTSSNSNAKQYGLAEGHAYAILAVFTHDSYGDVVKMFNPWREDFYKGEIPNTVEVNGPQSGVFTMKFAEFKDAFDSSQIAQVHKGYVATSKTIATGQSNALSVRVDKPGQFFISMTWPGQRMMEPCKLSVPHRVRLVAADDASKVHKSKLLTAWIANYNSLSAQVENVQGGKYEVFATVEFPSKTWGGDPAVAVDKVQFTVYAPSNAEIKDASVTDVSFFTCVDSATYKDPEWKQPCSAWDGYECSGQSFSGDLEKNCQKACRKCDDFVASVIESLQA